MRLDKYLKVSRIIKRRTIANEMCDAGKVSVNESVARASYNVKIDDIIEISMSNKNLKFKVAKLNETCKKENAFENYIILD